MTYQHRSIFLRPSFFEACQLHLALFKGGTMSALMCFRPLPKTALESSVPGYES